MKLDPDVVRVLDDARIDGCKLFLGAQLARPLYERTNKVLVALGGRWERKAKAHVFDSDPRDVIATALDEGSITTARDLGYFPTPTSLARSLVVRAGIRPGDVVVEPSAGEGAIVAELIAEGADVRAVEVDGGRVATLRGRFSGLDVLQRDWLQTHPSMLNVPRIDAIVMNPPFRLEGRAQADVDHVSYALDCVREGGSLVAVMSAGVTFRQTSAARQLRARVEAMGGSFEPLPEGAFKASGTDVRAVVLTVRGVR